MQALSAAGSTLGSCTTAADCLVYALRPFSHATVPDGETRDMPVQDGGYSGVGEGYLSQESCSWAWFLPAACQGGEATMRHNLISSALVHSEATLQHASLTCGSLVMPALC